MIHNMNAFSLSIQVPVVPVFHPVLLRQNAYYLIQNLFTTDDSMMDDDIVYDNRKTLYTWSDVVLTTDDELNQSTVQ